MTTRHPDVVAGVKDARQLVATNLRRQRRRAGLSQEALASATRLHRTELSLLERGERDPRVSTLVRLARALAIEPCELLGGAAESNPH